MVTPVAAPLPARHDTRWVAQVDAAGEVSVVAAQIAGEDEQAIQPGAAAVAADQPFDTLVGGELRLP